MEAGDGSGCLRVLREPDASCLDDGLRLVERIEMPVDDRLVDQLPQAFSGLQFGRIGRQVDEPDPVGNDQAGLGVPARIVEDGKDDAPDARAGFLREGVEQRLEQRLGDAVRDIPEGFAGRRRDEGGDVEPLIAMMPGGQRALSARRPDAAHDRLQADPALIGCKDFDRRVWMLGLFLGDRLAKLFLKAAASSGVADFGFLGRGFWIVQPIARSASRRVAQHRGQTQFLRHPHRDLRRRPHPAVRRPIDKTRSQLLQKLRRQNARRRAVAAPAVAKRLGAIFVVAARQLLKPALSSTPHR